MTTKSKRNANPANKRTVPRTADPYRDLDVIDARAPRASQATIGTLALLAYAVDWWPLLAILALQLLIGLRFGRQYCLPCLAYFELIQRRFGEGPIEDSRPPRFANQVGLVFLGAASLAHLVGLTTLGWVLGLLVAGLALLAAITGFCVGCELYKLGARFRGILGPEFDEIDPQDLGVEAGKETHVLFAHPLCTDCHQVERELTNQGVRMIAIDVKDRPDLARRYGISVVPTVVTVDANGAVAPSNRP